MQADSLDQISLTSFNMAKVCVVRTEPGPEEDRVRFAIIRETSLAFEDYDHVAFESSSGTQYFRAYENTASGAMDTVAFRHLRVLSFSISRDEHALKTISDLIQRFHSHQEPVSYICEAYATDQRLSAGGRFTSAGSVAPTASCARCNHLSDARRTS